VTMRGRVPTLKPSIRTLGGRSLPVGGKQPAQHIRNTEHVAWREAVLRRAGHACEICGRTNTRLFADHIQEVKDGGSLLDLANGQCLCGSCHTKKTLKEKMKRYGLADGQGGDDDLREPKAMSAMVPIRIIFLEIYAHRDRAKR
jgi:5-methylcytosine-specific restriction enzyme A